MSACMDWPAPALRCCSVRSLSYRSAGKRSGRKNHERTWWSPETRKKVTNEIKNRKLTSQLRPPRNAIIAGRAEGFTLGRKQGPKELYNSFAQLLKKN